jgi:hypothetical protein
MTTWSPIPADTDEDAHRAQAEAYRRMGGSGRVAVAFRLTEMARQNSLAGIRRRHPEYDDTQVQRAYGRLVLGDDLARAVWPDHDLVDPWTPRSVSSSTWSEISKRRGFPTWSRASFASSHHGRPRSTQDADIVFDPTPESLDRFVARLIARGLYVDREHARDALRRRRPFNAVDASTGWKIDLVVVKARPFSREELRRRQLAEILPGTRVSLATAEDTILSKLEWAKISGGSEKQLLDVAGVVEMNPDLDRTYVEHWARELDVLDLWRQVSERR